VYAGKVIDFHLHIGRKEDWHPWVINYFKEINPYIFKNYEILLNPDKLEEYLTKDGIEYAVVLAEDSPMVTGVVKNSYVHNFCRGKKMFIPFSSINPITSSNPEELLEKYISELGFKGLKLYPTYQHFFPYQKEVYSLYEKAVELCIPVMFHTGSSIYKNSKLKYGDPLHLDEVAVNFPELRIVMAHSGRGFWYNKAFFLSKLHNNLYMEISGLPPKNLLHYFPELEENSDKIIFGSDWPGVRGIKENIDVIRSLPLKEKTIEKILYRNAEKVLRIKTN